MGTYYAFIMMRKFQALRQHWEPIEGSLQSASGAMCPHKGWVSTTPAVLLDAHRYIHPVVTYNDMRTLLERQLTRSPRNDREQW